MGIKNLKKFIREKYSECIKKDSITRFSREKIAIDISSYIYKYKAVFGDKWFNPFINLIMSLKKFNVHGVFVFDGKPPKEKEREKEKRKESRDNIENTIINVSIDLDSYKVNGVATPLLFDVMNKIKSSASKNFQKKRLLHSSSTAEKENYIDVEAIEDYIQKKEKQVFSIEKEEIDCVKKIINLFGASYIQAPGEAEALCSYMCVKEHVSAVLTEDTDVLAYTCPLFVSDFNTSSGECEIIEYRDVLENLELSSESFLDFCIMCGTDYNDNIPNYGCNKVYGIIKKYESIDGIIEFEKNKDKKLNFEILNYKRGREIFSTFGNLTMTDINVKYWDTVIDFGNLYSYLGEKNINYSSSYIEELWKPVELCFED